MEGFEEERTCNTCKHYDPEEGACRLKREMRYSYEGEDCEYWADWEEDSRWR